MDFYFLIIFIILVYIIIKNRVRADDLVKTPVSHDKGAPCCCNPPALLLSRRITVARHWQGKQSQ